MKYFTFDELTYSRTAVENGLLNKPGATERDNLAQLVERLLDPLRERLGEPIAILSVGEPIAILSGYRSPEVNTLVGGVPDSQHTLGEAADCYCLAGPERLLAVLRASGLPFDQAIVYRRRNFLHLSYRAGRCRGQILYR